MLLYLLQNTLSRDKNIGISSELRVLCLHRNLPLTKIFNPNSLSDPVVQLYVAIKIPIPGSILHVVVYLLPRCVEVSPLWIWRKRECL